MAVEKAKAMAEPTKGEVTEDAMDTTDVARTDVKTDAQDVTMEEVKIKATNGEHKKSREMKAAETKTGEENGDLKTEDQADKEKTEEMEVEINTEKTEENTEETKTERVEEKETEKAEEAKTEKAVEAKTEKAAEAKTEKAAEAKTEKAVEAKTEKAEETNTEKAMETKTEKAEETNTEKAEETDTEKAEETKTEKAGETLSEKAEAGEAKTEEENDEKEEEDMTELNKCPDLEKKIIKQVEFYFGDFNLGRDRFLQGQIKEDSGWVKLEVLLTFNRLRSLTHDAAYIAECIGNSKSGLLVVSEDKLKVRRSPDRPLPEQTKDRREALKARSIYAKGFACDMTLEQAEAFFEPHGEVEHIQMRSNADRSFKGSVFAIFAKIEDARKFVEAESLKHGDVELLRLLKDDYFKKKLEEKKTRKEDHLKQSEDKKKDREMDEKESFRDRITKGSVLHLDGLPNGLTVEELRTLFSDFGEVAWVEYQKGDAMARVRFVGEDEAKTALEKAQGNVEIKVKDTSVKAHVLEGDEEIDFWKSLFQGQRERKERAQRGKRGRGGRGFGRGGPPNKKRRTH